VDAAVKAIEAFPGPLIVILGGKDKGSPYTPLRELLRDRARMAILVGAAAEKIAEDLGDSLPVTNAGTLDRAVQIAAERAQSGDTVCSLRPAPASTNLRITNIAAAVSKSWSRVWKITTNRPRELPRKKG